MNVLFSKENKIGLSSYVILLGKNIPDSVVFFNSESSCTFSTNVSVGN